MTATVVEGRARPEASTRPTWRPAAIAAALYLLAACLRYWPVPPWSSSWLLQGGHRDPAEMTWFLAWTPYAVGHGLNPLFTSYLDAPLGVNLASNTSVPFLGLVAAPITLLFGPITTFNVLTRLALAGSALAMCLVLRRWVRSWPAAFLGGALYGFSSYELWGSTLHLNLVFLVVPPLLLAVGDELLVRQRRSPLACGLVLGVLVVIQWFIDSELAVDCALLGALGGVVLGVANRHRVLEHLRWALPGLAACTGLVAATLAYPVYFLAAGPRSLKGPVLPAWLVSGTRNDLASAFLPAVRVTASAPSSQAHLFHPPELTLTHGEGYLGPALVALLLVLGFRAWRSGVVRFAAVMAAAAFTLSLGGRLSLFGHATDIPLPGAILARLPLLQDIVPVRISALTSLFLAMILAVGLDRPFRQVLATASPGGPAARHARRPRRLPPRLAAAGGLSILVVATFVPLWVEAPPPVAAPGSGLAAARLVARHTARGATVLFLPWIGIETDQPMVWQAETGMSYRMLDGYDIVPQSSLSARFFDVPRGALRALVDTARLPPGLGHPQSSERAVVAACRAVGPVIRRYHLDAIVATSKGPDSPVNRALTRALGPPPLRLGHVTMWDRLGHGDGAGVSRADCQP